MRFLAALVVDGALAGTTYALIALAFVVVYKASRLVNLALGEWVMLGSRLTATGVHALALGFPGALGFACAGMIALAVGFNRAILRRLVGQPLIAFVMVSLGFGALARGAAAVVFASVPGRLAAPTPADPLSVLGIAVAPDRLLTAVIALVAIGAVSWLFHGSRTGVALRALADDQQAAMAVGIDIQRHFGITWALVGVLSALGGALWTIVSGGGFGLILVGLKIFPIVILGGLDSLAGAVVGGLVIGVLESLAGGYLDPFLGGGFGGIGSYLVLLLVLLVRPYGLFGRADVERV